MNYIRYPMTSEQLRESLVDWDNQDKIILMDNEFVHYLGEAVSGLILETESLKQRHYIDVQHIEVQGVSDDRGNFIGYYVPDDNGIFHLLRSILNVTNELMELLEPVKSGTIVKVVLTRNDNGSYSSSEPTYRELSN